MRVDEQRTVAEERLRVLKGPAARPAP
jgi:hypothetical protein